MNHPDPQAARDAIEALNAGCFCISVDPLVLRSQLEADADTRGLYDRLATTHAYLFAKSPIFVSRENVAAMESLVEAAESVIALPQYREKVLAWAPAIARFEPGTSGVLMGYDFHVTPEGPRLIEVNTNAGGAFLNAALARAQQACCEPVLSVLREPVAAEALEDALHAMFEAEWGRARGSESLRRIAIVDERPVEQYLYPEFLLAAQLFRRHGVEAVICDPSALEYREGGLRDVSGRIDLVYNRLTDFALEAPAHAALRSAYIDGATVLTPHPRAHALHADKRNLAVLSDAAQLASWGVEATRIDVLRRMVPHTQIVDPAHGDALWAARKGLFFKPVAGYGGKAAYRGDKLTRRTWSEILAGSYVAQQVVPASERSVQVDGESVRLKLDVRCYTYDGRVLMLAARLYQGQTTNFRTPGGGFATVFCPPARGVGLAAGVV
jgi:hypothetical protein